jgi:hypothetical protein
MTNWRWMLPAMLLLATLATAWAGVMPSNTVYVGADTRGVPAALAASRAARQARSAAMARLRQTLIARHALPARAVLPRFDTFVMTAPPTRTTRAGGPYGSGTLTFAYTGWTADEEAKLRAFLGRAYPVMVNVYGAPAITATLTLVKAGGLEFVEGGEFNTAEMTLKIETLPDDFAGDDTTQYGLNLLHLVLHAFHAPLPMGVDAWEEGLARAAATVVMLQLKPNFPLVYAMDYLLPLYDTLNQPALSSPTFFPNPGIWQMSLWRIGMATSAWLKIYTEKPDFFTALNSAYYAQLNAGNAAIRTDLVGLKGLLAGVITSVEGQPTLEWYGKQYALASVTTVGKRLFLFPVPLQEYCSLQIYCFTTNADATETPLPGTAALAYYTFDNLPLYPEEGDTTTIAASGDNAGLGIISPSFYNIGETPTQRIQFIVSVNGMNASCYYPAYARGDDTNEAEIFGTMVGADAGTLHFTLPGVPLDNTPLVQGAFTQQLPTGDISFFAALRIDYTATDGTVTTFRRNVGPGFYVPQFEVSLPAPSQFHTFMGGTTIVAFPVNPAETDIGNLLSPNHDVAFRFATWDPTVTAENKYREYPAVNTSVPGRGYWLRLPTAMTVNVKGTLPTFDAERSIVLEPGWNMIGNTFTVPMDPWGQTVIVGNTRYTMDDAIAHSVVTPVWGYDQKDASYRIRTAMNPWEGGWMYNNTGGQVTVAQRDAILRTRRTGDRAAALLATGGWAMNLQAACHGTRDTATYLGVNTRATRGVDGFDWAKPPSPGAGVRVAFVHPDRRNLGAAYATDLRAEIGALAEQWEFEVRSTYSDAVTLSWPSLTSVPKEYALTLVDVASGQQQYLRTTGAYVYQATGTEAQPDVRRFRLTVAPRSASPLSIVQMEILPTRGAGVSVRVMMNRPADLLLDVRTPTGKLVRTIRVPADRAGQAVVIPWDGRGAANKLVPTGTYIFNLTARTAEGFTIRRTNMGRLRQ